MAVNISEAHAIHKVISFFVGNDHSGVPDRDDVQEALTKLADAAYRALHAGPTGSAVAAAFDDAPRPGTALAALAVVDGLDRHVSHNGAIPWPTVRRPYDQWRATPAAP